jgi:hypothetical protein
VDSASFAYTSIYRVSIRSFPDYKHLFFNEPTIAANVYMDILEVYVAPQKSFSRG